MRTSPGRLVLLCGFIVVLCAALVGTLGAQSFSTVHLFAQPVNLATNVDGATPGTGLVLSGTTLYGVTENGGTFGSGTVFSMDVSGLGFSNLYNFSAVGAAGTNADGAHPIAPLLLSGGILYGTAFSGGAGGSGTVFMIKTNGTGFKTLHSFTPVTYQTNVLGDAEYRSYENTDGANPSSALLLVGGVLYGAAYAGGGFGNGTLFSVTTDGTNFTPIYTFTASLGTYPGTNVDGWGPGGLCALGTNLFYGTAQAGGPTAYGTVFSFSLGGSGFSRLYNFSAPQGTNMTNGDGYGIRAGVIYSAGVLYGTAELGGSSDSGTIYSVLAGGSGFQTLHAFSGPGSGPDNPCASLVLSGSTLYGTTLAAKTAEGGFLDGGGVFSIGTGGLSYSNIYTFSAPAGPAFTNSDGFNSGNSSVLVLSGSTLYGTAIEGGISGNGTIYKLNTDGSGFVTLHSFSATQSLATNVDGGSPYAGLALAGNTLYGAASSNGPNSTGTIFQVLAGGSGFSLLHAFSLLSPTIPSTNGDGAGPQGTPVLSGTTLFGTAYSGGSAGNGTVFSVNTANSNFVLLHPFTQLAAGSNTNSDGANPYTGLVLSGGELYGTAEYGGSNGNGTVFKLSSSGGGFVPLHSFTTLIGATYTNGDGGYPLGGLAISGSTLYGTAYYGGTGGNGVVFRVDTNGLNFTNLHSFTAWVDSSVTNGDGANPVGTLIASGNVLFGTASAGGAFGNGTVFRVNNDSSNFTNLYSFSGVGGADSTNADGAIPVGGLVLSGSTLYGVAQYGGATGYGTVFAVDTNGSNFTTLYSFTSAASSNSDGAYPLAQLILSSNTLYGTAYGGGDGAGTVFSISLTAGGPSLVILHTGNNVVLSWSTNFPLYSLQGTTNLSSAGGWTNVLPLPVVITGQNVVTNSASGPRRFYRLMD